MPTSPPASNTGSLSSQVTSDFLDYESNIFSRDRVVAAVDNANLAVDGLDVRADNGSTYLTLAQANGSTVRGEVSALVDGSTVAAGAGGVPQQRRQVAGPLAGSRKFRAPASTASTITVSTVAM